MDAQVWRGGELRWKEVRVVSPVEGCEGAPLVVQRLDAVSFSHSLRYLTNFQKLQAKEGVQVVKLVVLLAG